MADGTDGEPDLPPAPAAGPGYVKAARFDWLTPVSDLLVVTLAPGSFDAIVSSLLFHHLLSHDEEAVLARARELLRPGGGIHVADWGRPQDPGMRLLSLAVRILDGSASTRDSLPARSRPSSQAPASPT